MRRWIFMPLLAVMALFWPAPDSRAGNHGDWSNVVFPGGDRTLKGDLYRPKGKGPFKAVLYNHGSKDQPGPFDELAAFFNRNGFVFFVPHRTGHGRSPGASIGDKIAEIPKRRGYRLKLVQLLEEDNSDVVAAVTWLKTWSFVDANRVVMAGLSFGGIQTLISAERDQGVRAFIAFAPAAQTWRNHILRQRLSDAIAGATAPVFILQAENDFSTKPVEILGVELRAQSPKNRARLYPPYGGSGQEAHGGFATQTGGIEIWGPDVLSFISAALSAR
jgi:dienelactone hydrolase